MASTPLRLVLVAATLVRLLQHAVADAGVAVRPGCPDRCGDVAVPFPFGIGAGCYHSDSRGFNLTCDRSTDPPRLLLGDAGVFQVHEISIVNATVRVGGININMSTDEEGHGAWRGLGDGGPFTLSDGRNELIVVWGCDVLAMLTDGSSTNVTISGCASFCPPTTDGGRNRLSLTVDGSCTGVGCCQMPITVGRDSYDVRLRRLSQPQTVDEKPPVVLIAEMGWLAEESKRRGGSLPSDLSTTAVPVLLGWTIASTRRGTDDKLPVVNSTCSAAACKSSNSSCRGVVTAAHAGYVCDCHAGYQGNPYLAGGCQGLSIFIGASSGVSIILLVIMVILLTHKHKQRRAKKLRKKYFIQNRGQLLQQLVSQRADIAERMIIPLKELEKATNKFDRARELGGGGHVEVAKAIAYLHSSVSIPIIHRDIKTANILLDDALISKVSDFGASRCIPVDQTGMTTRVQGTLGYMDPTYYYTQRLTQKSDVYSFGVILIELLTRKKPFSYLATEGEGLVAHFVTSFTKGNLVDILDPQVMEEADIKVVEKLAALVGTCVKLRGEDRPTMRQVEMALEGIQASREQFSGNLLGELFGESNNAAGNFMPTQERRSTKDSTRQYSLEKEFLLSTKYPRGKQAGGFGFMAWSMPRRILFAATVFLHAVAGAAAGAGLRPDCPTTCGDVTVPFPFGIGAGCYHSDSRGFNLTCDRSTDPPRLLLGDAGVFQVHEISIVNATVRAATVGGINITYGGGSNASAGEGRGAWRGLGGGGPFALSENRNELVVVWGCDVMALLLTDGSTNVTISGCASFCPGTGAGGEAIAGQPGSTLSLTDDGRCTGVGCCQMPINVGRDSYDIRLRRLNTQIATAAAGENPTVVLIAEQGWIAEASKGTRGSPLPVTFDGRAVPVLLEWTIGEAENSTCPADAARSACKSRNSSCRDVQTAGTVGYVCDCDAGYQGNPYLAGGCQDINECERPEEHGCFGECINTPGSFQCQCPAGTQGDHTQRRGCVETRKTINPIALGLISAVSLILVLLVAVFIIRKHKRRTAKKAEAENRGQLLQQLVSQRADIAEKMIIPLEELKKATNNFDKARELGGGGHGTVYKGILSDLQVVAIKKSNIVVQREIDEFINEVVILSQINHRNVVKLFGCCLETEVPLLVYEFVSNGTLYSHLHGNGQSSLSWVDRLRIATKTVKAIAYLHSSVSIPIIHRDIKSANILLDDTLTAKVSDFGASRCIPVDQTGITTRVQGTLGYMDPTYYYTQRLTEKSDVYSFGVILIELLTRKKPFSHLTHDGEGLVAHFVNLFTEGNLVDILDPPVMKEACIKVVEEVAALAVTCVNLRGEDRPTMRHVEMALEGIQTSRQQSPGNLSANNLEESNNVARNFLPTQQITSMKEGTRQYSLEEEFLLSASDDDRTLSSVISTCLIGMTRPSEGRQAL
uniref:Protein kinase domain-containing protein n=1 Tax=Leersia perrieri TaxID=77586 RepID=A0A0D9XGS7_9ORYZ